MTQDRPSDSGEPANAPHLDPAIYDALHAALSASARGRAFLDEVVRRGRNADTVAALAALVRIEAKLNASLAAPIKAVVYDDGPVPQPAPEPAPPVSRPDLPRAASDDLIARVMALSPEERIALFS